MRILFTVLLVLLVVGILTFLGPNLDTTVTVTVWNTSYEQVPFGILVILAVVVGVVFTSIFAIVEGARNRIENRRLRREIHRLETEIGYLRNQPAGGGARPENETPPRGGSSEDTSPLDPASAPVYDAGDGGLADSDDDVYSGGRAV